MSLRQNILLIIGIITALVYYVGFLLRAFGVSIKIQFLHSPHMLWVLLIVLSVFTLIRNIFPFLAPIYV